MWIVCHPCLTQLVFLWVDYGEYTKWRLSAFFWGGCVGVFSTQGLLLAVGVGRQSSAPLAAALQWVIRDGVGRAGRMLFSQVSPVTFCTAVNAIET